MTTPDARPDADVDLFYKSVIRGLWARGDYHRFATATVWDLGAILVEACGIGPGQRVLDVAAGTGNTAIRAAEAGADVVASDLTPENFDAGRREAEARGVELEWREADAEHLPFEDASFDAVTSSVGALFSPDHQAVAREMARVCRPRGTIGMINFRPTGVGAEFFALMARYVPEPPVPAQPPLLWGDEDHVRALFGDHVSSIDFTHGRYTEVAEGGAIAYRELFYETFGPIVGLRELLGETDPERLEEFDADFLEFATRCNRAEPGEPAEYPYDYLLVVATRAG